jgi:hypothetical protein
MTETAALKRLAISSMPSFYRKALNQPSALAVALQMYVKLRGPLKYDTEWHL